jgi:ABC-2 type transport system permease protein
MLKKISKNKFLFKELVKRDFKKKYKRTTLGIFWSMLMPLLQLLIMSWVFKGFFGRNTAHYTIYLFSGNLLFSYFRESTDNGMTALEQNANIFSKVNVPKYMFLLSKNVSALINFLLTLIIYFVFVAMDSIPFSFRFLLLAYPVMCLVAFNLGLGMILSALHMFFKDIKYLWSVAMILLNYMSAIFYTLDTFTLEQQRMFLFNPIYNYILYFRTVVIAGQVPSLQLHVLCLCYALLALLIGCIMYYKYNYKFLYYI